MREERRPLLIEAVTYRFRGHSMADPEDYRTKEEVAQWRERDPIPAFGDLLEREGALTKEQREQIDRDAMRQVDEAVEFAESSPFPDPDTLYEDVYVLDEQAHGHYHWSPQVVQMQTPHPSQRLPTPMSPPGSRTSRVADDRDALSRRARNWRCARRCCATRT